MIKFLATRRWNYIEIAGFSLTLSFAQRGLWIEWGVLAIATLILSRILVRKAGIE